MRLRRSHREVSGATTLPGSPSYAIELRGVGKTYGSGEQAVIALRDVDEGFVPGTFTAVMGPSGSGKSTLIQCAAGLDTPTSGSVLVGTTVLNTLKEPDLTITRRREIGFIFQAFNLLPSLDAQRNIELPVRLAGGQIDRAWVDQVIESVGIAGVLHHRPAELSGGQQQRVAIARAMAAKPRIVFADEPTGALDTKTARAILTLLRSTVDTFGQTMIMVTHDPVAASYADRVLFLANGRIVERLDSPTADAVATRLTNLERHE